LKIGKSLGTTTHRPVAEGVNEFTKLELQTSVLKNRYFLRELSELRGEIGWLFLDLKTGIPDYP
jgi:hypothetical protein